MQTRARRGSGTTTTAQWRVHAHPQVPRVAPPPHPLQRHAPRRHCVCLLPRLWRLPLPLSLSLAASRCLDFKFLRFSAVGDSTSPAALTTQRHALECRCGAPPCARVRAGRGRSRRAADVRRCGRARAAAAVASAEMEDILREARAAAAAGAPLPTGGALPEGLLKDVDLSKYKKEATQIWSMLDDMAEHDPAGYAAFVRRQYEIAESEKSGRRVVIPDVGLCVASVATGVAAPSKAHRAAGDEPPPPPPADLRAGARVYLNLVSHTALLPPKDAATQRPVVGDGAAKAADDGRAPPLATLLNLEIPLAVGPWRPVRGTARSEWAVDVLVHKWVVRQVDAVDAFFPHFVAFVAGAVAEETGVTVAADAARKLSDTDYTGGTPKSSGGSTAGIIEVGSRRSEAPVKFDLGPMPGAKKDASKKASGGGGSGGGGSSKATAAAASAAAAAPPPPTTAVATTAAAATAAAATAAAAKAPPAPMASPADLLRSLAASDSAPPLAAVSLPTRAASAAGASPPAAPAPAGGLIREVAATAAGVCDHTLQSTPDGGLCLRFTFSPAGVDVAGLRMAQLELEVAPEFVVLRVAPDALRGSAADADTDRVGVVTRVALPARVDPDATAAKLSCKGGAVLTVTLARAG